MLEPWQFAVTFSCFPCLTDCLKDVHSLTAVLAECRTGPHIAALAQKRLFLWTRLREIATECYSSVRVTEEWKSHLNCRHSYKSSSSQICLLGALFHAQTPDPDCEHHLALAFSVGSCTYSGMSGSHEGSYFRNHSARPTRLPQHGCWQSRYQCSFRKRWLFHQCLRFSGYEWDKINHSATHVRWSFIKQSWEYCKSQDYKVALLFEMCQAKLA